jgi:hypothetical protein
MDILFITRSRISTVAEVFPLDRELKAERELFVPGLVGVAEVFPLDRELKAL